MARKNDKNPWGRPPKKPSRTQSTDKTGGTPPPGHGRRPSDNQNDWDKMMASMRDRFDGDGPNISPLWVIALLALIWLATGIYIVQPQQHGVVQRFGRYVKTVEQNGLHYHWPWPIESVHKPNVTFERRIEIGFTGGANSMRDIPDESLMLTGDGNIVNIDFVVQWKIGSAHDFLFNIREPEGTIKKVAESAMREVVGQNNLQSMITDRREAVANSVRTIMQTMLDEYGAGVTITQVLIQDATVPPPVMDAFEDVIRADQDAETMKNEALKYKNDIIPRARGDAIRLVKEAEGYRARVINQAQGDAQRFRDVYQAYSQAKDVTRERLYLETIEDILRNSQNVIFDDTNNGGGSGIVPYLPLNELNKNNKAETK